MHMYAYMKCTECHRYNVCVLTHRWVHVMAPLQDGKLIIQKFSHSVILLTHSTFDANSATLWLCVCVCVCACIDWEKNKQQLCRNCLCLHLVDPLALVDPFTWLTPPHQSHFINGSHNLAVSHYTHTYWFSQQCGGTGTTITYVAMLLGQCLHLHSPVCARQGSKRDGHSLAWWCVVICNILHSEHLLKPLMAYVCV